MRYARVTTVISLVTFLAAIAALAIKGLNFGVEFTGGTVMELHSLQPVDTDRMREALANAGFRDITVQHYGGLRAVQVRLPIVPGMTSGAFAQQVLQTVRKIDSTQTLQRVEFTGPQLGKELYENGGLALLVVVLGIMGYLMLRFEWRFAVAGIVANLHDVVIILGFFAFFQWDFSVTVLGGVLAILAAC